MSAVEKQEEGDEFIIGGHDESDSEVVKQVVQCTATISVCFIKHIYCYSH